jgi:hypothetical protein
VRFEMSVRIAAPIDAVWGVLSDVESWSEWTDSVDRATWVQGSTVATGSRARIEQPRMPALEWTVSECEPPRSFTWRSAVPGVATTATHVLQELSDGTVSATLGVEQHGLLAPVAGLMTRRRSRAYVRMEAEGLKRRAERTGPDGGRPV